jgi:hypothetical protein
MHEAQTMECDSKWMRAAAAGLTRRRAIRIVAAAAGLPLMIAAVRATAPPGQLFNSQGEVLGALAEVTLWHTDAALARRAILKMRGEIARYERIFSLYDPQAKSAGSTRPAPWRSRRPSCARSSKKASASPP